MLNIVAILFLSSLSSAEYRAFELAIINSETGKERTITSTLDHIQYAQYYPVQVGEIVQYLDSWMCWERTNNRPICKKPE